MKLLRSATLWGLLALSVLGIHLAQSNVAPAYGELSQNSAIYAMPSRPQLLVMSLGYRSALADVIFGNTLVSAGIHFSEHRVFHHLDAYLEGILALDAKYRDVYAYADTLLNLSTVELPKENLRIARDIMERGLTEFPLDADLWMNTGLFVAYMAPQRLAGFAGEDVQEWRAAGARMLSQACAIWPSGRAAPSVCVTSASLLQKTGETEAAIAALQRMLVISDEPKFRADVMTRLERLSGEKLARRRQLAVEALSKRHVADLPAADRLRYQLLTPPRQSRDCIGRRSPVSGEHCATSWRDAATSSAATSSIVAATR